MAELVLTAALAAGYTVDGTALVSKDRPLAQVEIGDTKQAEFFPQLKICKFANEVNASFRLVHDEPAEIIYDHDAIVWRAASLEARFYGVEDVEEKDGHEFSVTLFNRPRSNVLTFTVQSKGLEFSKQPFFANGPDDEGYMWQPNGRGGIQRHPPNVDGSYAAYGTNDGDYTALGGHNYRSGKAFHIYRPWAQDAKGVRVWCDLHIDNGLLTITIPPAFLDAAVYPVLVDPTFGYSGAAASDDNVGSAHCLFKATTTPASNGTLDSVTIKGRIRFGTPQHCPAIYSDTAGAPVNKLAGVESGTAYSGSDADITTSLSYGSIASGVQYWLGTKITGGGGTLDGWIKYDASGGLANFYLRIYAGGDTTAWEATTASYTSLDNEKPYIFGTYTAAGAPVEAPYVPPITGEGLAFRESKADYVNRALYSTVMLWGGGADRIVLQPDTLQTAIVGERALQATQTVFQQRSRLATRLLWPVPTDAPPANVLSPPYQAPLVGERALATTLRQQAGRAQLATTLLFFAPSDASTATPQPDTYQPPLAGEGALQASARRFAQRSTQSNALLWPPAKDPAFVTVAVPPLAGEGLWARALNRQATQSRLATALLIFAPSDLAGNPTQPVTAIQPIPGQGAYAAAQRQYRLGADRANRLLWTMPENSSTATLQPTTYQPPVIGEGVYRRSLSEQRRRALVATALLLTGSRDAFVPPVFNVWWATNVNKAVGILSEPR